ncbi:HNH endonuclease [Chryseobacterium sp. SSA4.19]|uniref:HNH endonuclease n=1 Tax=Chryseobacterium sp. SSA4.19 TaxID=2919915 RepID=UPI001F4E3F68|nr:HNH endonuclease [Chryseobacterium sp. SSA4.19]MCJ8154840.1 HNH endonuclease [Chryseobacterium sp. SSA4.19]
MKIIKTEFVATLLYGIDHITGLDGLIIESRGGTKQSNNYRNPEHSLLLAYVLKKIQNANVSDLEIYVASNSSNYKNIEDRKVLYNGNVKINLNSITDFESFLKSIKKSIKQSGQKKGSTGGNSTKRITLYSKTENLKDLFTSDVEVQVSKQTESELEYTYQRIKKRLRQSKFRKELLEAYDYTCAVTGSKVIELLEAAHIQPYNGVDTSVVSNGILLRSDIHDLFDLETNGKRLISISADYVIEVHSALKGSEYWKFNRKKLNLPVNKNNYPKI